MMSDYDENMDISEDEVAEIEAMATIIGTLNQLPIDAERDARMKAFFWGAWERYIGVLSPDEQARIADNIRRGMEGMDHE